MNIYPNTFCRDSMPQYLHAKEGAAFPVLGDNLWHRFKHSSDFFSIDYNHMWEACRL